MENNIKTNKRIQNTRAAIDKAFKEMIASTSASAISVKDLTHKAGIHRKTFYSHYASIEDLYDHTLSEIIKGFVAQIDEQLALVDLRHQTRIFFEYFAVQEPYVEKIICDSSYRDYCATMFANSIDHNPSYKKSIARIPEQFKGIVTSYLIGATLELYRQWVKEDKVLPIEEITPHAITLIFGGFDGYIQSEYVKQ